MRILVKKNDDTNIIIEIEYINCESRFSKEHIAFYTPHGFIYVDVSIDEADKIQEELLKNGWYDFRKYYTDFQYYKGI